MSSTTTTPPEQLTLLPEADVPLRFRLDEATRARGLRHIAVIRAQLERQTSPLDTSRRSGLASVPHRPSTPQHAGRPAA